MDYIAKYKTEWKELESLVKRGRKSMRRLSPSDLSRLDVLYRRTAVHLAQIATRTRDQSMVGYLNDLMAAAHSLLYLPPRRRVFQGAWEFVARGFARAVARTWKFHLFSAGLMLSGGLLAYWAVTRDLSAAYALMPDGELRMPGASAEMLRETLREGRDEGHGFKFIFTSFLFTNNIKVGFMALATGVLAGVPTILLMIYNGMILGAFTAIHHMKGIYAEYWAWILPHGITELSAVALFGGCGLMLGWTVINPGWSTRPEALLRAGRQALTICLGGGLMLVLAAIIESYLRQSNLSTGSRYFFAAVTLVFWCYYFGRGILMERRSAG